MPTCAMPSQLGANSTGFRHSEALHTFPCLRSPPTRVASHPLCRSDTAAFGPHHRPFIEPVHRHQTPTTTTEYTSQRRFSGDNLGHCEGAVFANDGVLGSNRNQTPRSTLNVRRSSWLSWIINNIWVGMALKIDSEFGVVSPSQIARNFA